MGLNPTECESGEGPSDRSEGAVVPDGVTDEMVARAMDELWNYSVARGYIDEYMMRRILRAALSGVKRTAKSV